MQTKTLYEALGGEAGVHKLAKAWHKRVMENEIVSHAFQHGFHPQHTERLAAYWGEAWGGPNVYSERYGGETRVARMHSGNGQHEDMDQQAIECFDRALDDIALTDPALKAALHNYFAWSTRVTMNAYPDSADQVPDHLRIPVWTWDGLKK